MKNRILKLVSIVVVSAAFFSVSCNTHTYFGRWMTWRASDIEDYTRFPSSPLPLRQLLFGSQWICNRSWINIPWYIKRAQGDLCLKCWKKRGPLPSS